MSPRRSGLLAAAGLALALAAGQAQAAGTLTVCLDENVPPWSVHRGGANNGFDYAVAQAVAQHLGRTLSVQWFESELDEDKSTTLAADALMSDGKCQLTGGYPLLRDALGKPGVGTARLPGFEGSRPADRGRRVALETMVPTKPYHRAVFTIVLGGAEAAKTVKGLGDLVGLRLGVDAGTLSDAVLMLYDNGKLVDHIKHVVPGHHDLLPRLEHGDYDATLVELRRFDNYRDRHPDTKLRPSGYYYRVGFNMGFVGLDREAPLIAEVNRAIGELLAEKKLPALAKDAGMTYVPPAAPDVLEHLTIPDLEQN